MPGRFIRPAVLIVAAAFALAAAQAKSPPLEELLKVGGAYIAAYEKAFSAIVSEEFYTQRLVGEIARSSPSQRLLKSDLLLMDVPGGGWVTFRDVFEVDGHKLRDRNDRLVDLILKPRPDALQQVERINEEGARFNLGPIARTLNTPTLALMFLRDGRQDRSRFRFARMTSIDGQRAAEIEFVETAMPRMVRTVDDAPACGRFWLDPDSGRILKTEMILLSGGVRFRVLVTYKMQERIALMAPGMMEETYELEPAGSIDAARSGPSGNRIEGSALYSNFRSFNVDTSTIIRK